MSEANKPTALVLADALLMGNAMIPEIDLPEAAAELRRLHARLQELSVTIEDMQQSRNRVGLDIDKALRGKVVEASLIGTSRLRMIAEHARIAELEGRQKLEPLTDEQIEQLAKPFVRSIGGDHWYSGEDGIPDRGQIEEFARAIEHAHGIKEQS